MKLNKEYSQVMRNGRIINALITPKDDPVDSLWLLMPIFMFFVLILVLALMKGV